MTKMMRAARTIRRREKVVMNRIVTKKMEGMFDLEYICQLS